MPWQCCVVAWDYRRPTYKVVKFYPHQCAGNRPTVSMVAWLKDILSPSNLWAAFQFCFPAAAAIVMGWLSSVGTLPTSIPILVALITASCVLIILDSSKAWF